MMMDEIYELKKALFMERKTSGALFSQVAELQLALLEHEQKVKIEPENSEDGR